MSQKDTYKYHFKKGKEDFAHSGITKDLEKREQRTQTGVRGGPAHIKQVGRSATHYGRRPQMGARTGENGATPPEGAWWGIQFK